MGWASVPRWAAFTKDASRLALMGTAGAQYRVTSASVPGVPDQVLEFIEFKGIDRKPQHTRIQDPGSAKIQFRPSDVAAAMAVFQTAGGKVATTGGTFMIYMGVPTVIIRDMNNMFINMQQQPQPPAATTTR